MAFEYIGPLLEEAVQTTTTIDVRGRVEQVVGTIIRAVVPGVKVGELCLLKNPWESFELKAEVVGFIRNVALLSPLGSCQGVSPATEVIRSTVSANLWTAGLRYAAVNTIPSLRPHPIR